MIMIAYRDFTSGYGVNGKSDTKTIRELKHLNSMVIIKATMI